MLDATVVNIALPALGEDLDAGFSGLQWTVNGYTLTLASLILLGGSLGDRFGRRRVFVVGAVWFAVASLLCGAGAERRAARRRAGAAGGRRRAAHPGQPGAASSAVVPRRRTAPGRSAPGPASAGSPVAAGPVPRRAARRGQLALGLPAQPARWPRSSWSSPGGTCRSRATTSRRPATSTSLGAALGAARPGRDYVRPHRRRRPRLGRAGRRGGRRGRRRPRRVRRGRAALGPPDAARRRSSPTGSSPPPTS